MVAAGLPLLLQLLPVVCVAAYTNSATTQMRHVEMSLKADDALAALSRSRTRSPHARLGQSKLQELKARIASLSPAPPPYRPPCPPGIAAEVQEFGWISVTTCGAIGNLTAEEDTAGIELAINLTKSCGTNTVWFPPAPGYQTTKTIVIDMSNDGIVFQGSSGAPGWGVTPPLSTVTPFNFSGPVFLVNSSINGVVFNNLNINACGQGIALKLVNSANVRVQNCGVAASPRMVDDKAPGSQVRLGSDNAALVM